VDDGTAQAVFVVFDSDMSFLVGKPCHDLVAEAKVFLCFYLLVVVFSLYHP
jgi:hypothetical protein